MLCLLTARCKTVFLSSSFRWRVKLLWLLITEVCGCFRQKEQIDRGMKMKVIDTHLKNDRRSIQYDNSCSSFLYSICFPGPLCDAEANLCWLQQLPTASAMGKAGVLAVCCVCLLWSASCTSVGTGLGDQFSGPPSRGVLAPLRFMRSDPRVKCEGKSLASRWKEASRRS